MCPPPAMSLPDRKPEAPPIPATVLPPSPVPAKTSARFRLPQARPQKAVRPAAPQAQREAANSESLAERASVLPVLLSQLMSPELAASVAPADMELLLGRELPCVLAKSPKKKF